MGQGNLFIVGRICDATWDFQGVFDTYEKALAACIDESFFIGPCTLNKEIQLATEAWPNAVYPKA